MPYRKEQFINGEIYHTIIRGIDENLIFIDINDYYRGIFSIYELNNANQVEIRKRRRERLKEKEEIKRIIQEIQKNKVEVKIGGDRVSASFRDKLVEILAFCFMPNHLHLLLRQLKDSGITKFMAKLGIGYGGYFNRKYDRKGYVFQNRFVAVYIKNDKQLKDVFTYIHANPISLIESKWKENGIQNPGKIIKFLENYKWSSYQDYIGKNNFTSITERGFMFNMVGGEQGCKDLVENWVRYKGKIKKFKKIALE